jgi:hypothetical protein
LNYSERAPIIIITSSLFDATEAYGRLEVQRIPGKALVPIRIKLLLKQSSAETLTKKTVSEVKQFEAPTLLVPPGSPEKGTGRVSNAGSNTNTQTLNN